MIEIMTIVVISLVVAVLALIIGFCAICIPYLIRSRKPKQYSLKRKGIEEFDIKRTVNTDAPTTSAVDESTAVTSFKTD